MFESAIDAAAAAASRWTPECADPVTSGCCDLCLHRYGALVLTGPLRDLPHPVAHAAVVAVDDVIWQHIDAAFEQRGWASWSSAAPTHDPDLEFRQRVRAAEGALTLAALDELAEADRRFADLRARFTEPAVAAYVRANCPDEVPVQWRL